MSAEGEKILSEALNDYSPGNTDPITFDTGTEEMKQSAIEWIDARAKHLFKIWSEKFDLAHQEILPEDLENIAHEFADLENDFNYVKELNTYTSKRYQQVWDVLPSVQELDLLIKLVSEHAEDETFFTIGTKDERIKKLLMLRNARKTELGG